MNSIHLRKKNTTKWFRDLRNLICKDFEYFENNNAKKKIKFTRFKWKKSKIKSEGGGEISILRNGNIFEKVGVNISVVNGRFDKNFKNKIPGTKKSSHFNTRYIITSKEWFGGGMDVTPCIKDDKQKKYFHQELKKMCSNHNKNYYKLHKLNCDKYFFLPHRNEPRGDGGIFYDYLNSDWEKDFLYTKDVGKVFLKIAKNIIQKKMKQKWTKKDKGKQLIKRARYAEFNLLHDRGTKFGLSTGGNIEAIFMSLPPLASW
jgi:coproporphyrinogen III oxidase